jgi:hypothetical protein
LQRDDNLAKVRLSPWKVAEIKKGLSLEMGDMSISQAKGEFRNIFLDY